MCGIYGLVQYTKCDSTKCRVLKNVKKHQNKMKHRGPDWEGCYQSKNENNVYMAHYRLSIIDPSGGGQPIIWNLDDFDKDMLSLSVNGEIYNCKDLEKFNNQDLRKVYEFKTFSDCECIMAQYQAIIDNTNKECIKLLNNSETQEDRIKFWYNEINKELKSLLNRINGMFAFVLYDNINKHMFVARDPYGICPLYYGFDSYGGIHFASEMKAMPDDVIPISFQSGHYMYFSTDELLEKPKLLTYYTKLVDNYNLSCIQNTYEKILASNELDIQMNNCRTLLTRAVSRRLRTDVPFGMLLSGGLDSSLVCSIACKLLRNNNGNSLNTYMNDIRQITTFCIGLESSPDLLAAEKVAKFLGTKHYGFTFTIEEGINAIRDVIWHLETYDATTIRAATPMYLLSRKIKAMGMKMVLSGEGSDESGAGYLYFLKAPNSKALARECLRRIQELQYADNLRANKVTMAWGLEARVPFQDKEFVEWAITLPSEVKIRNGVEKWIYRKSFDTYDASGKPEYLPPDLLWRQKNQFSDISDSKGRTWIDAINEVVEQEISDYVFSLAKDRYPHNTPVIKQEYYFRCIFDELFPGRGRELTVHKSTPNTEWEGVYYDSSGKGYQDNMASDVYDSSKR
jgi:asparagine synthase (glutamine-hydrolysing)